MRDSAGITPDFAESCITPNIRGPLKLGPQTANVNRV